MKTKNSFIKGAAILSVAGMIVKVLGVVYRIPLTNIITTEGIGLYYLAYPLYSLLIVLSTAGFPVAISKLVSQAVGSGDYYLAHKTFKISRTLMLILGLACTIIMIIFSGLVASAQGNPDAKYVMIAIAPSLVFVALLSAYRGYFQGLQNMVPTAVSQIIEQFVKLAFGLLLAALLYSKYGVVVGTVGAILGVTISEVVAFVWIYASYSKGKKDLYNNIRKNQQIRSHHSPRKILTSIIKISIPIAIGSAMMPIISMIDQMIVLNKVKDAIAMIPNIPFTVTDIIKYASVQYGTTIPNALSMTEISITYPQIYGAFVTSTSTKLYGILSGSCSPILSLPIVFSTAIAMSVVPAISESYKLKRKLDIRHKTITSIRLTTLISFPCAVGLFVLAEPIIRLLYRSYSPWEVYYASRCLKVLSITIFTLPLTQISTAILQGVGRQNLPVINFAVGAIVLKIPLTLILVSYPEINVIGAAIGTVAIDAFTAIVGLICIAKITKTKMNIIKLFIKPFICSAGMGISAYFTLYMMKNIVASNIIRLIPAIIVGIIMYIVLILLTRSIHENDFSYIPKGHYFAKKFNRFLDKN